MSSNYKQFFESSIRNKNKSKSKDKSLSFEEDYTLPKDIKTRDDLEKGFKDYLSNTGEPYNREYIAPPFEASKVPSPVFGYNKRKKKKQKIYDYKKLKNDMSKDSADFILFEEYATDGLKRKWKSTSSNNESLPISKTKRSKLKKAKHETKKSLKRNYGLNRSLASIIEDEKSGNNNKKREVPGFFESETTD